MKKRNKIFAALLAVTLVGTMLFSGIFANDTRAAAQNVLNITRNGVSNTASLDFENYAVGSSAFESSVGGDAAPYNWAPILRRTEGDSKNITVRQQSGPDGLTTNKYISHRRTGISVHPRGTYVDMRIASASAKSHNITDYSYIVFDFDICADEYVYTLDDQKQHGTEVPEGATDVSLAYAAANIYLLNRDSSQGAAGSTSHINLVKSDNRWYVSVGTAKAPLSDILGAWNHITMAFCINTSAPKPTATMRYYVNGEYLTESTTTSDVDVFVDSVRFNMGAGLFTEQSPYFSIGYDNISCHYYDKNYTSGEDVFGIDDYYKDPNHTDKKFSICEDIVYIDGYSYAGTPTPFSVSIKHEGVAAEETFYSIKSALAAIKDRDIVTLNTSLAEPFTPDREGDDAIKLITFKLQNGVEFTLDEDSKNYYVTQTSGNVITLKYDVESALKLNWYNGESEVVYTQNLLPLYAPNPELPVLKIHGKTDVLTNRLNPTLDILLGWDWDIDSDGVGDNAPLSALTAADFLELREAGVSTISIVSKYKTVSLAFAVQYVDKDGNLKLYAPDYDFEKMSSLDNLFECIANIDTTDEIIVTLYKDLALAPDKSIVIPEGKNVAINLNGHKITQAQSAASQTGVFTLNEGSTLSVYSSIENGIIETTGVGYGVFTAADINAAKINLGARYDGDGLVTVPGANLAINAGSLFNFAGSDTGRADTYKITVDVNGGTYLGTTASIQGALLPISELDVNINLNGATVATLTGEPIFKVNTALAHSAKIAISKSTVASLDENGAVCPLTKDLTSKESITITDSTVLGLDTLLSGVTLGAGCKLGTTDVPETEDVKLIDDTVDFTVITDGSVSEELTIGGKTVYAEYTVTTALKNTETDTEVTE